MKRFLLILVLFTSFRLAADIPELKDDLRPYYDTLGKTLSEIWEELGEADEMYTQRGPSEGQDSVVFYYTNHMSLYWTGKRVWQIRIDQNSDFTAPVLYMGMKREDCETYMGEADIRKEEYSIYALPQKGYPVSCVFYFEDDILTDIYVYRSDF